MSAASKGLRFNAAAPSSGRLKPANLLQLAASMGTTALNTSFSKEAPGRRPGSPPQGPPEKNYFLCCQSSRVCPPPGQKTALTGASGHPGERAAPCRASKPGRMAALQGWASTSPSHLILRRCRCSCIQTFQLEGGRLFYPSTPQR